MIQPYYVCRAWHDFPEGGTYATLVMAASDDEAGRACLEEMAVNYIDPDEGPTVEDWCDEWMDDCHVIDCFPAIPHAENLLAEAKRMNEESDNG